MFVCAGGVGTGDNELSRYREDLSVILQKKEGIENAKDTVMIRDGVRC